MKVHRFVARIALGLIALASVFAVVAPSRADFSMAATVSGIRLGARVSGEAVTSDDLESRVVLLEFWGLNCPPCIRSLPMLEELHRTLGPEGLVVIGAHAQGGSADEIRPHVAKLGLTFPVVENASVDGARDLEGIPHCMLFDHTGRCIYRGSPFEVHDAAVAAVKAAPGAILGGRTLVKLTDFNKDLRDERKFPVVMKRALGLERSNDADTADEASFVVGRIEEYGKRLLSEATAAKTDDPARATDLLDRCTIILKGTPSGIEAAKLRAEWERDKEFQAVVKAHQQMARLEEIQSAIHEQFGNGGKRMTEEMAARIPSAVKGRIRLLAQTIIKAAPDSPLAKRATDIAAELGVIVGT
jgi:thiol-disulfide isomerase/thioredoxin